MGGLEVFWKMFGSGNHLLRPSGLVIELVANGQDTRTPWVAEGVSPDQAVQGLYGVTLAIREPAHTIGFLTEVLGWQVANEDGGRTRLDVWRDVEGGDPRDEIGVTLVHEVSPETSPVVENQRHGFVGGCLADHGR